MTGLDLDRLLTIDVDAEIRKLGRAEVASFERLPAVLAARALQSGARSVEVSVGAARVEVRDDGSPLGAFRLADLAVLLDRQRTDRDRHASLISLEAAGCGALLALASLPEATAIELESTDGAALVWRRGRPATLSNHGAGGRANRIAVEGSRLARHEARRLVSETCRFASARVAFDGDSLTRGFEDVLGEAPLAPPLAGRVAIPSTTDGEAHVWLLVRGAVAAHTTLAGYPAFFAALELGDRPSHEASALRDAAEPLAPALARQALQLLARLARRPARDAAATAALRGHVLRAARRMPGAHELRRLPVLPTAPSPGAPATLLSIAELARLAGGDSVTALFPDQDPAEYRAPPGRPLMLLDAAERSLLDRLAGLRFLAPPRRWQPSRLLRLLRGLRRLPRRASARLRAWRPVRPLREDRCSEEELALLGAVRALLPSAEGLVAAGVCAGGGRPRRRSATLWLPRRSPEVLRASRALSREGPAFARTAALSLLPPDDANG